VKNISRHRYFPISDNDRKWNLYVTTCGHTIVAPNSPYPPEKHPAGYHFSWSMGRVLHDFVMVYIAHGKGIFESKSAGRHEISEGTLFLVQPNEWHRYRPAKESGWTEYWVGFDGENVRSIANGFIPKKSTVINCGPDENILTCFLRILELSESSPIGCQQIMSGYALAIIGYFYSGVKGRGTDMNEAAAIIHKAKCYIMENITEIINQEALAAELNVSYSWLRQTFRYYTGMPLLQYQIQLRISKAQGLLANSVMPIYAIAEKCGFESCYYFSRLFKKKTGISPSFYRNKFQPSEGLSSTNRQYCVQ